jgi:hypothetical protein
MLRSPGDWATSVRDIRYTGWTLEEAKPSLTWEPVSGFEPLACRLQEVRPCAGMPASCTDDTGHGTDHTHRAGIIWRAVPRNVPRPKLPRPLILLLCVTSPRAPAHVTTVMGTNGLQTAATPSLLQCCRAQASVRRRARIAGSPGRSPCRPLGAGLPDVEARPAGPIGDSFRDLGVGR